MERIDDQMENLNQENIGRPRWRRQQNPRKALAFGLVVVLFGLALLLRNMNLLDDTTRHIIFSWQMLLIAIGVINLFDHSRFFGIILILVGVFFLSTDLFIIPLSLHHIFWPTILIIIGLYLIFGKSHRFREKFRIHSENNSEDVMDYIAVFGGGERTVTSQNFSGGRATAIFGGGEINLLNAKLAEGTQILEITCLFGGIKLIVPSEWNIKTEVIHILGGSDDKRPRMQVDPNKTLIIKGIVMFGGSEIKSY
jgi:predicted membrane protein